MLLHVPCLKLMLADSVEGVPSEENFLVFMRRIPLHTRTYPLTVARDERFLFGQ